jgi:hypothetical protein
MELAPSISAGLAKAADADWAACVSAAFSAATQKNNDNNKSGEEERALLANVNGDAEATVTTKEVYAAVLAFALEACKHNATAAQLRPLLDDAGVGNAAIDVFLAQYATHQAAVVKVLSQTSFAFPSVVGIDWKLDYLVKSDALEQVRTPIYSIALKTQQADGRVEDVNFSCNYQELQDLLHKLQDASKQVERILNKD